MARDVLLDDWTRRDFLKTCVTVSAMLGLPFSMVRQGCCGGTSERQPTVCHLAALSGMYRLLGVLLRSSHPMVSNLILDLISLDYHETLMAGSGFQAEKALHDAMHANKGSYILVVEGAIPTGDNGIYCKIAGVTARDSLVSVAKDALAVIAIGTCAGYGGIQSVGPNPTGAVGVRDIIKDKTIINISGSRPTLTTFFPRSCIT